MGTQIKTIVFGSVQLTRKLGETISTEKQATRCYTVPFYTQQNDKFLILLNTLLYTVHLPTVYCCRYQLYIACRLLSIYQNYMSWNTTTNMTFRNGGIRGYFSQQIKAKWQAALHYASQTRCRINYRKRWMKHSNFILCRWGDERGTMRERK